MIGALGGTILTGALGVTDLTGAFCFIIFKF